MNYYSDNILLGSDDSDVRPVTGLNQYCKVSMSEYGYYDKDDQREFISISGFGEPRLKIGEDDYIECQPWGNVASSVEYYSEYNKFLAKNVNCPIPIRSTESYPDNFTNNSPFVVEEGESNRAFISTNSFPSLSIAFSNNHIMVSDSYGEKYYLKGPAGCSTVIIDVQGRGGNGGNGKSYSNHSAGGGGGGSGAFATILLDMKSLMNVHVTHSNRTFTFTSIIDDKATTILTLMGGEDGGDSTALTDYVLPGQGGKGGTAEYNKISALYGVYLLAYSQGATGGTGGCSYTSVIGKPGSSLSKTLFSGPLEDGVKFEKSGEVQDPSNSSGGEGGASLFSSGTYAEFSGSYGSGGGGGNATISTPGTGGAGFLNFYI